MRKIGKSTWRGVLFSAVAMTFATMVMAQTQTNVPSLQSYEPGASDAAKAMLAKLFGSAAGILSSDSGSNEWFGNALLAFNLGVLAVAGAWFTWNVVSAVMQGSFDGEFLGRRYHSMWMPIRNVTGLVLLVPAWKGWSLAQLSMAMCASLGIGIANSVAGNIPASSFPLSTPVVQIQTPGQIFDKMGLGWQCVLSRRENLARLRKANVDSDEPSLKLTWTSKITTTSTSIKVTYGVIPASDGFSETECGSFGFDLKPTEGMNPQVAAAVTQGNQALINMVTGIDQDLNALYSGLSDVDPDNVDQLNSAAKDIATRQVDVIKKWQTAYDNYFESINAANQQRTQQAVRDAVQKNGWIGAGVAGAQTVWDSVQAAANASTEQPSIGAKMATDAAKSVYVGTINKVLDSMPVIGMIKQATEFGASKSSGQEVKLLSVSADTCDFTKSPDACMNKGINDTLKQGGILTFFGGSVKGSPLVFGPVLGIKILTFIGWSTLAILGIFAIGALLVTPLMGGGAIGSLLQTFTAIWFVLMAPLALFALQLIVFVPAQIVIAWIFAVASWLVICAEAFVASPLWALAHMDTDGEGMGQRTAHGYIYLLNLLFRPAILVITVGFAYAFAEVIGSFANEALSAYTAGMLKAAGQNWIVTLILFAAALWLVVSVNLKVVEVAASLLSIIPNQIFTWIGGHFGSDVGSGVGSHVGHDFKGGGQAVTSGIQGAARNATVGMDGMGRKMAEASKDRADKAAAENEKQSLIPGTEQYNAAVARMAAKENRDDAVTAFRAQQRSESGGQDSSDNGGGNLRGSISSSSQPGMPEDTAGFSGGARSAATGAGLSSEANDAYGAGVPGAGADDTTSAERELKDSDAAAPARQSESEAPQGSGSSGLQQEARSAAETSGPAPTHGRTLTQARTPSNSVDGGNSGSIGSGAVGRSGAGTSGSGNVGRADEPAGNPRSVSGGGTSAAPSPTQTGSGSSTSLPRAGSSSSDPATPGKSGSWSAGAEGDSGDRPSDAKGDSVGKEE